MGVQGHTESRQADWVTALRYYHGHQPRSVVRPTAVLYGLTITVIALVTLLAIAGVIG
jgi:hypothetical protein